MNVEKRNSHIPPKARGLQEAFDKRMVKTFNMTDLPANKNDSSTDLVSVKKDSDADVITLHSLQVQIIALAIPAIETLKSIMASKAPGKSAQIRLNAAKTVLDRIDLIPPKASDPIRPKSLEDMTRDELHKVIRGAERILGDRATPVSPAIQPHVSDILD